MKRTLAAVLLAGCSAAAGSDETALTRYQEGNRLFEKGFYADAIPLYESALSVRGRLKDAYHRLAYCYEIRGEESRAVETLEHVLRVDPQDEYALRHLWRLYCRRGFPEQALAAAEGLVGLYPTDPGLREEVLRLKELKAK